MKKIKKILNKKALLFLLILFCGGFFYFAKDFSGASVFAFFGTNREVDVLKSSLRQAFLEITDIEEENYLLKEELRNEKEKRAEVELNYQLEIDNFYLEIDLLTDKIMFLSSQIELLAKDSSENKENEEDLLILEEELVSCFIDINLASRKELEKIIGIGPVIAQRIIENRPFSSIYGLINVFGIGEITLKKIIDQGCAFVENDLGQPEEIILMPVISYSSSIKKESCSKNSIEINTASQKELEMLAGIGPVFAQRIIEERLFFNLDDLIRVSGIGLKTLEDIKSQQCAYLDQNILPTTEDNSEGDLENENGAEEIIEEEEEEKKEEEEEEDNNDALKNLLKNEFFNEFEENNVPKDWQWQETLSRIRKIEEDVLVGEYNLGLIPVASHNTLIQKIEGVENTIYYAEIWAKGINKTRVRIGIRRDGHNQYGDYFELENNQWTKISYSRESKLGNDEAMIISILESEEKDRSEIIIGTAWFGLVKPQEAWPF